MTRLFYFLFFVAAITASFDLIGSFDVAGGNLRITNLVMVLFGAGGLLVAYARSFPRVRALGWLVAWTVANAICMINAPAIFRTYAYTIWLVVDVLFIFSVATVFRGGHHAWVLTKINYVGYAALAAWGVVQFALSAGGMDVFVKQKWTAALPRINGFSYEPSYYATYLIVGWAAALYLLLYPIRQIGLLLRVVTFALLSVALLLCTSRLGYFGMAVTLACMAPRIASRLWASGKYGIIVVLLIAGTGVAGVAGLGYSLRHGDAAVMLEGTGLAGTHAHSVDARTNEFLLYWDLFRQHPFRGYSLGGIAGVMAGAGGAETVDYSVLRKAQGANVSFEIILAAGVLGAPLFFFYFFQLTGGLLWKKFFGADPELVIALKANAWGLLIQFLLLQFNQNILRNYFWIQLAVVSCLATEVISQCRFAAAYAPLPSRPVEPPPEAADSTPLPA